MHGSGHGFVPWGLTPRARHGSKNHRLPGRLEFLQPRSCAKKGSDPEGSSGEGWLIPNRASFVSSRSQSDPSLHLFPLIPSSMLPSPARCSTFLAAGLMISPGLVSERPGVRPPGLVTGVQGCPIALQEGDELGLEGGIYRVVAAGLFHKASLSGCGDEQRSEPTESRLDCEGLTQGSSPRVRPSRPGV